MQAASIVAVQLAGVGAAVGAALLALVPAARPWRGRAERTASWGAPLALGLAVAAAFAATRSLPTLPPRETLHWVFYLALLAAVFGAYEARPGTKPLLARAISAVLLPVVLLEFQRKNHWNRLEGILWTGGLAAWAFLVWHALLAHARRVPGPASTLGWALATALAAGTYGFAGGALYSLLAAALALATGACALLGLWRGEHGLGASGLAPFVLLHSSFLWLARFLYELSAPGFALLSLAPLAAWLSELAPAGKPRTRAALALLGPTLCAGAALVHELIAAPPPSPYG